MMGIKQVESHIQGLIDYPDDEPHWDESDYLAIYLQEDEEATQSLVLDDDIDITADLAQARKEALREAEDVFRDWDDHIHTSEAGDAIRALRETNL